MAKKVMETEEEKKPSILERITGFLKSNKGASEAKADDEEEMKAEDEEPDAETVADDEEGADAKADDSDDSDDDDDQDDPDKDDDDDSDEDDIEVNGSVISLKDPAATRKAIEDLLTINAAQLELLTEAAEELAGKTEKIDAQDKQIKKTVEEVKKEIKSTFTPPSSKRSSRITVKDDTKDIPDHFKPKEGSMADRVLRSTLAKANAGKKQ